MTIPKVSFSYWSNNKNIKPQENKAKLELNKSPENKEPSGIQGLFLTEIENLQKNRKQNPA